MILVHDHIIKIKKEIKKYKIEKRDLTKLNPLKWKEIEGERVPRCLNSINKINYFRKQKKHNGIMTLFYNIENEEELNPMDIIGKKCFRTSSIKIESIFIGSGSGGDKVFLQVKLYECGVNFLIPE